MYHIHLQGWGVSQARNQQKQAASTLKMEAVYSLKHQAVSKLHSIVGQKIILFKEITLS
jgi:hypothetical protein